jgi:hypothetical protein
MYLASLPVTIDLRGTAFGGSSASLALVDSTMVDWLELGMVRVTSGTSAGVEPDTVVSLGVGFEI